MAQESSKLIIFTGGGTAGHVFPAFPVVRRLRASGFRVEWIGSRKGIESRLIPELGLTYHGVPSGKLRRYFSFRNFVDFFFFLSGIFFSLVILAKSRPRPVMVVSKGGFAGVGPIVAARFLGIPGLSHESDITPGLATRLNMIFGARMILSYHRTMDFLPKRVARRAVVTGNPVRDEIFSGDPGRLGEVLAVLRRKPDVFISGWTDEPNLPIVLVCGGSQGARKINRIVYESLGRLLDSCFIIHQRGIVDSVEEYPAVPVSAGGYVCADFFGEEMPHILAAADLVVGRAGAGFVWEMAATGTPGLLLPLKEGSRGDQILNANVAAEAGFAVVLDEDISPVNFAERLSSLVADTEKLKAMSAATKKYDAIDAADKFLDVIRGYN